MWCRDQGTSETWDEVAWDSDENFVANIDRWMKEAEEEEEDGGAVNNEGLAVNNEDVVAKEHDDTGMVTLGRRRAQRDRLMTECRKKHLE